MMAEGSRKPRGGYEDTGPAVSARSTVLDAEVAGAGYG